MGVWAVWGVNSQNQLKREAPALQRQMSWSLSTKRLVAAINILTFIHNGDIKLDIFDWEHHIVISQMNVFYFLFSLNISILSKLHSLLNKKHDIYIETRIRTKNTRHRTCMIITLTLIIKKYFVEKYILCNFDNVIANIAPSYVDTWILKKNSLARVCMKIINYT